MQDSSACVLQDYLSPVTCSSLENGHEKVVELEATSMFTEIIVFECKAPIAFVLGVNKA